jgi:NitT/TauT family transport system permease protein
MSLKRFIPILPQLSVIIFLEIAVQSGWVASYLVPAPSQIFTSLFDDHLVYAQSVKETFIAASLGLILSFVCGLFLATVFQLSTLLHNAIYPYTIFFQTVPIIAIAPLLVIWFGFGIYTVTASAFIVSLFPILANAMFGLANTDKSLLDLFKLYKVSRLKEIFLLRIPYAKAQIFNGVKIASGLSIIGAIVGEFIAGGGLGGLIDTARTQQRVDQVFAAVILSSIMGLLFVATVSWLSGKESKKGGS